MIVRNPIKNTKTYRQIERDSYSTLKCFVDNSLQYYKEQVLGEKRKEKKNTSLILGSIVDCLLTHPEEYYLHFEESNCGEIEDTTQIGEFTLKLWEFTEKNTDEDGDCNREFPDLALDAYNAVKFDYFGNIQAFKKKTLEKVLAEFHDSKYQEWYDVQKSGIGKTIVSQQMRDNADKIVETVKNSALSWIFKDAIYQQQVEYNLFGLDFKSMFDIMILDEDKKELCIYDLKVSWELLIFEKNYLSYRYYIQAGCYYKAALEWLKEQGLQDYTVNIGFLTADATNQHQPLLYILDKGNIEEAINGFTVNGRKYKGVKEICIDLTWAKTMEIFDITYEDYRNNNVRKLKCFE